MQGLFITFEGVEGCGKTTQLNRLSRWLQERGLQPEITREPGGTPFGLEVRSLLLNPEGARREPIAELLLYLADRYQDLQTRILPALAQGRIVLCDRYHDATLAYQGYARRIPAEVVERLGAALAIRNPDLTVLLDIDPAKSLQRAIARNQATSGGQEESRFEQEHLDFHRRVREGYLILARRHPARFAVLNADRSVEEIFSDLAARIAPLLPNGVDDGR